MRAQRFIGMAPAEVNVISGYIAGGEGAFHWPTHRVRYSFLHGLGTQVQLLLNRLGIHSYTIGKHSYPRPEKAEIWCFFSRGQLGQHREPSILHSTGGMSMFGVV